MQFFGSFLGVVYAKCILHDNIFAAALHAAMKWSTTDIYLASRSQVNSPSRLIANLSTIYIDNKLNDK